ncbi:MarR family transcriptional regulator [Pseudomaricurvus alcaniphilus]|uniref:MarR family winged helix-turn-helix transcriptional regulator n=1 Tax=Pseudomaricurvus alcaniphilus TaxID=1166482 RepID=UPI00140C16A2|nr:MarR family transcriptional regulator [Pseudomaricurvus alcaniphilus]NHN36244.1 MarR family transcriptional regulator [Pseudomaricurvus alcaniphilus]
MLSDTENKNPLRHGYLLHDVSRLRRTVFDQHMKPRGITRSQWWVLTNLARHKDKELTQVELARLLDVGKVTIGGLLDRLDENGFIVRTAHQSDRRSKRIAVSKKGRKLLDEIESMALELNNESMQGVTEEQYDTLVEVLSIIKKNLMAMDSSQAKGS